jgi:YlmC/YmxH family sporulation protein
LTLYLKGGSINMCRIAELRNKEVINICDGERLGYIYDVEVEIETGCVVSIIVPERGGFFSLFGAREYVIPWSDVKRVGDDIVLVETNIDCCKDKKNKRGSFCG